MPGRRLYTESGHGSEGTCFGAWQDHLAAGGIFRGGATATDGIRETGSAGAAFADCIATLGICDIPGAACMDPRTGNDACRAAFTLATSTDPPTAENWAAFRASDATGDTYGACLEELHAPPPPPPVACPFDAGRPDGMVPIGACLDDATCAPIFAELDAATRAEPDDGLTQAELDCIPGW